MQFSLRDMGLLFFSTLRYERQRKKLLFFLFKLFCEFMATGSKIELEYLRAVRRDDSNSNN